MTVMKRGALGDWGGNPRGTGAGVKSPTGLGVDVEGKSRQFGRARKPGRGTRELFPTGDFCPGRGDWCSASCRVSAWIY